MLTDIQERRLRDRVKAGCYDWLHCICERWPELVLLIEQLTLEGVTTHIIEPVCCRPPPVVQQPKPGEDGPGVYPAPNPGGDTPPSPPGAGPIPCMAIPDPEVFEQL